MTWVDLVVLAVLGISGLLAFLRGFVREVLGLMAWLGAIYVAMGTFHLVQPSFRSWIDNPDIADPVAFAVVFLVALAGFSLVAMLAAKLVRNSGLRSLDRTLGLVFGLVRGAAVVVAAYIVGGMVLPVEKWPDVILLARSLPVAYGGAAWVAGQLPEEYRPHLSPPPAGRDTSADALLHATPQGYALSGRAASRP